MSKVLISVEGKMIRALEGERPWINEYHGQWCVMGYEWMAHHNRWSRALRTYMSAGFAEVMPVDGR